MRKSHHRVSQGYAPRGWGCGKSTRRNGHPHQLQNNRNSFRAFTFIPHVSCSHSPHTAHGRRGVKVANFGRFRKHLCAVSPCAPVITIIYALILRFVHDHGAFCQPASQPACSTHGGVCRFYCTHNTHTPPAFVRSRHTVLPNQLLQTFFRWAVIDSAPGVVPWHRAR